MYEQYFSNFEYVDKNSPYCFIRLIHPIFNDVIVIIAKQFRVVENKDKAQEIKFDYEITEIPDNYDVKQLETEEFIQLVRNIFMAILEDQLSGQTNETKNETNEKNERTEKLDEGTTS